RMQRELEVMLLVVSKCGVAPQPFDQLHLRRQRWNGRRWYAEHGTHKRFGGPARKSQAGASGEAPVVTQLFDRAQGARRDGQRRVETERRRYDRSVEQDRKSVV